MIYRLLSPVIFPSKNYRPASSLLTETPPIDRCISIKKRVILYHTSYLTAKNSIHIPQAKMIASPIFERFTPIILTFPATILIVLTFIILIFDTYVILVSIFAMSTRDKRF